MRRSTLFLTAFAIAMALMAGSSAARVAAQAGAPPAAAPASSLGTGFTYQGQLNNGGTPVTGTCEFQFSLYDALAGPAQVGATQTVSSVAVAAGKFTVLLNAANQFGSTAFTGSARWLSIAVRCPSGSGAYTTLAPRQSITAAPYAQSLMPGSVIEGVPSGNILLTVHNTDTSGNALALYGQTDSPSGSAVAGFSVAGTGVVGQSSSGKGVYGTSTSGTGVYGNGASGGVGVWGTTGNTLGGIGVKATNVLTDGVALDIDRGAIQVNGAGINTDTAVFIHEVDTTPGTGNLCVGHSSTTVIDNDIIYQREDAILIVTPNYGSHSTSIAPADDDVAVYYDDDNHCGKGTGRWVISNIGPGTTQPNGAKYNVLVILP